MFNIKREKNIVIVEITVTKIAGIRFPFKFDAGSEWAAVALENSLSESLRDRIEGIKREYYEEGLKDARRPKSERREIFWGNL